ELNVTFAVRRTDEAKALNALHDNLFLSQYRTVHLFIVGTGLVGSALLDLVRDQRTYARDTYHVNMKIVGVTNRRRMLVEAQGIDLGRWREALQDDGRQAHLDTFMGQVTALNLANSMVIDCTASREVADHYLPLAGASVSIVTASKIANTLSQEFYRQLRATVRKYNAQFRYSTNVGAALPILDSIRSIVNNGDRILRIEGVLSGTLSAIFNDLHDGAPFSAAVRTARERGFTEPDPRTDLSGLDVARKLLILVRESGLSLELEQIAVQSLVPPFLTDGVGTDEFLQRLPELDGSMHELVCRSHDAGRRPMYMAVFGEGTARVEIQDLAPSHPFFGLTGNDNIVALTTDSLYERPLVLRGGGAGAGRTASGLFTDILQVAHGMS
ncbi:MAG TPA: bifunctional aspartate kinase/homoserine dehydrogenase I, partial [Bacteroidota bacterium]